jgi:hypothetical protein
MWANKSTKTVMTRLVRVIHAFILSSLRKDVDGPHKAGHDAQ